MQELTAQLEHAHVELSHLAAQHEDLQKSDTEENPVPGLHDRDGMLLAAPARSLADMHAGLLVLPRDNDADHFSMDSWLSLLHAAGQPDHRAKSN